MSRTSARFIPRLEAFDERCLPSVTVTETGGILQIVGDDAANQITILDDGTGLAGCVIVQADGQTYFSSGPISDIVVSTRGGTDTVDYWLQGTLVVDRTVSIELGRRNDAFTAHLNDQSVAADVSLIIGAFGRGGADRLTLDAQRVNVGFGALLAVDFKGGAGRDVVTFNYLAGLVDGTVSLITDERQSPRHQDCDTGPVAQRRPAPCFSREEPAPKGDDRRTPARYAQPSARLNSAPKEPPR